jgi:2-hydroxychromene-2-carboxylate isomerase
MSPKTLEFHFDFGSPTTYLAYTQVPRIAQETGAALAWHPVLLGGVFKAAGNASPITVPAKGRWMNDDMARWAQRWGVPLVMALVADPAVKADVIARTEASVARGAFGAPTFFVGPPMFFGQDRLDFVREALAAA